MSKEQVVVARKKKKKVKIFPIVNVILFLVISLIIMVPIWKVIVDSFDAKAGYGMNFLPQTFTLGGYSSILSRVALYRPFLISVVVTIAGTFIGLLLATLGAYVLIQWEMPGRNFFAYMLLFTMIFDGGMIPKYLVMKDLHLLNTLWSVILPLSINVYNLVLMRNFFEGVPESLFEAAEIDGANRWKQILHITIPCLVPMITVMLLLSVGNIMRSDTGLFYQVTRNSGQLYSTTQVIDSYVLNAIFKNSNFGFVAATTFFQSVVGLLMMLLANGAVRKIAPENALF